MDKMKLDWVTRQKKDLIERLNGEKIAARKCIELMEKVEAILPEWNEKVIDKKMKAAFSALAPGISEYAALGYYQYGTQAMKIDIQVDRKHSESFYYASITADNSYTYEYKKRDRLIIEPLLKAIADQKEYFVKNIASFENELANIDEKVEEYILLYDAIAKYQNEKSYTFRNFFNFEHVY